MGLNSTPVANRLHIGIFGRRNAGKSSVINAITGQELAIVSEQKGTTTDPVFKTMEILPLGPVMIIDTPGLDDEGNLGDLRIRKAYQVLNKTDLALLVVDAAVGMTPEDESILKRVQAKKIPYVIVWNKIDLLAEAALPAGDNIIGISALEKRNIEELKELLARQVPDDTNQGRRVIADLLAPEDLVVLVIPLDKGAPKGRLILPEQQTIRDILDASASALVVRDSGLSNLLARIGCTPRMVVTDSQAFERVAAVTPENIPLTSFSILFARYKGNLELVVRGVRTLADLHDGDRVLIAEGCTHHRQCNDIGTVKLPNWINQFCKRKIDYHFCSGGEFPDDLSSFRLVIHCGACMLNEREMKYRQECAQDQGVPITNYGISIAFMHGILKRSIQPFPELRELL